MLRRVALAACALTCLAAPAAAQAVERPIVYAVVIDGLDGDRVTPALAPTLTGLLQDRGTLYRESRSVMLAETNPNHTAMVTGAYGSTSGIPGNAFAIYRPLAGEESCDATGPEDLTKLPTVTSGEDAGCLLQPTVFEAVETQGDPDGLTTAGIYGKPKLGRLFAQRRPDGSRRADYLWAPCDSDPGDEDYCAEVPTNPISGYAVDDRTVMDQVLQSVRAGVGPQRRRPDFTFVNLHQVDTAGHSTGAGLVYDQAIRDADAQVARLVALLKERGEWQRTVMVVLSDHSMDTTLGKRTATSAITGAGVPEGEFLVVQNGSAAHVYLKDRTSPGRFALLAKMRRALVGSGLVDNAHYREPNPEDGGRAHLLPEGWHLAGERSGDLVLQSRPGDAFSDPGSFDNPLIGNHGGGQTRDNFFAVLGGSPAVRTASIGGTSLAPFYDDVLANPGSAENVDLAPTAMGLLGLAAPAGSEGRFLKEAFDLEKLPGFGRPGAGPAATLRTLRRTSRSRVLRLTVTGQPRTVDVQRRSGRRWVRVRRAVRAGSVRVTVPRRGTQRVRVRFRAASGLHSPWRTLRAPR